MGIRRNWVRYTAIWLQSIKAPSTNAAAYRDVHRLHICTHVIVPHFVAILAISLQFTRFVSNVIRLLVKMEAAWLSEAVVFLLRIEF